MAKNLARRLSLPLLPVAALAASACADPTVFLPSYQPGGPQGILDGTVTYSGPLPCTEDQHVLGAAVFLAFDTRLLPPPEGLGTSAASLGALGGDQLFGGVLYQRCFFTDHTDKCSKDTDRCDPNSMACTNGFCASVRPRAAGARPTAPR